MCDECAVEGHDPPLCVACLALLDGGKHVFQARIVGVLLMVHGALLGFMGAYAVLFGGFFLEAMSEIDGEADETAYVLVFAAVYGAVHVLPAPLQFFAGWRVFGFRARRLGLFAAVAGTLGACGIYCAPTSLGLAAYALYILTREDVVARFAVGAMPGSKSV